MIDAHKIAVLGEDVYILYVGEIAHDSRFLLLIYSLDNPEKRKVSGCNLHFLRIAHYGKKPSILGRGTRPQHIGASPFYSQKD
jgi:hypothetical protein